MKNILSNIRFNSVDKNDDDSSISSDDDHTCNYKQNKIRSNITNHMFKCSFMAK